MTILGYTWVDTYTISIDFNFSLGKQKIKIKEKNFVCSKNAFSSDS